MAKEVLSRCMYNDTERVCSNRLLSKMGQVKTGQEYDPGRGGTGVQKSKKSCEESTRELSCHVGAKVCVSRGGQELGPGPWARVVSTGEKEQ